MSGSNAASPPAVQAEHLRPYATFLILECLGDDLGAAFDSLLSHLKRMSLKTRKRGNRTIVADGLSGSLLDLPNTEWLLDDTYQVGAFVYRCEEAPRWSTEDHLYLDVGHRLTVTFRRERLIGIHCDSSSLREATQSWLDRSPRPPFRRVPESVINAAFLRGEARGLWLSGTHIRRTTRPDTKIISGRRLQDALLPIEDASFAMGSARAALPSDLGLAALSGFVGATPRKSQIWSRSTDGISDFFAVINEALVLVADVMDSGVTLDQPFPLLAAKEPDLSAVRNAFDLSVLDPDNLKTNPDISDEMLEAAELLERAVLVIHGDANSPSFRLDVGLEGSIGGEIGAKVSEDRGKIRFKFGFSKEPTNLPPVRKIMDALNDYADDLLTVYYESGHTIVQKSIWKREMRISPFERWEFHDFSGYNITQEKPEASGPQAIHDGIGTAGDKSLFAWVVHHYSTGWLICDDGSGEVADFIHLAPDSTLSFIHVKSANSARTGRGIAVAAYEVVASQATKNIRYLTTDNLKAHLANPTISSPAAWKEGERTNGRGEFMEMLDARLARDQTRVVIVQPHVSEALYNKLHNDSDRSQKDMANTLRLSLLEALLNSARGSIVALGADLFVVGSKE